MARIILPRRPEAARPRLQPSLRDPGPSSSLLLLLATVALASCSSGRYTIEGLDELCRPGATPNPTRAAACRAARAPDVLAKLTRAQRQASVASWTVTVDAIDRERSKVRIESRGVLPRFRCTVVLVESDAIGSVDCGYDK